jgi:acetyl-CoA carboxylase carboxyltransferase component
MTIEQQHEPSPTADGRAPAEHADWLTLVAELEERKQQSRSLGGPEAVARHHQRGKLTARERIERLLDPGSFTELGVLAESELETPGRATRAVPADGVITGWGTIDRQRVAVLADDATVAGGARGPAANAKVERVKALALEGRYPIVSLLEASAARIQESLGSQFARGGGSFIDEVKASGTVPRVVALMGGGFGQPSFLAMLSDFRPIVKGTGFMGMSGPPVVAGGTGEQVTAEELGGSAIQTALTGQADYEAEDDEHCLRLIRQFLGYMPGSCYELPPVRPTDDPPGRRLDEIFSLVPLNLRRAYNMQRVIHTVVDGGESFPIKPAYARNLITCFARLGGEPVGVIANQPMFLAGTLDRHAAHKAARFIDLCDAFHIPLLFFVDVPGFLVGTQVERDKTLTEGMRLMVSLCQSTVPKLTVIVRKSYGLAYIAMGGRGANPDAIVAWPSASISMMGPEAGVNVVYGRELAQAADPDALKQRLTARYLDKAAPYTAAKNAYIDDIIDPRDTRRFLIEALQVAGPKRRAQLGRKHPVQP